LIGTLAIATIGLTLYITAENKPVSNLAAQYQFNTFLNTHGKSYESAEEREYRFGVFQENLKNIEEWKKTRTFEVGVNQFSDLTWDEFKNGYLMEPTENEFVGGEDIVSPVNPIDWRDKKVVTPVKNQGQCGSCWAFSTTGSMEGAYALKTGNLVSFSEQQLVDCSRAYGNYGCNGGLMHAAYNYIIKEGGLYTEEAYPYKGINDKCHKATGEKVTV
jgi:C1A family cysteine protease